MNKLLIPTLLCLLLLAGGCLNEVESEPQFQIIDGQLQFKIDENYAVWCSDEAGEIFGGYAMPILRGEQYYCIVPVENVMHGGVIGEPPSETQDVLTEELWDAIYGQEPDEYIPYNAFCYVKHDGIAYFIGECWTGEEYGFACEQQSPRWVYTSYCHTRQEFYEWQSSETQGADKNIIVRRWSDSE
jgi:hypothetical protein